MIHHLAQVNVATLHHGLDSEETAEFVRALDPMNALAEVSPGFIWRPTNDEGLSASYMVVEGKDDDLEIVNFSIWADLESLRHYVYRSGHAMYLRRRREWFAASENPSTALWWLPEGDRPNLSETYRRYRKLCTEGPSEEAWLFNDPWPQP